MSFKIFSTFLLLSIIAITSAENCKANYNNCQKCDPFGKVCLQCTDDIYIPDENGGCTPSRKCVMGKNYCNDCSSEGNLCSVCETGYFPDQNGACSDSDNCEISSKGECLKCKENFMLLSNKFCKYIYSDDLKNCDNVNEETGKCESCEEGYFLNLGDNKCSSSDNCYESLFGICQLCTAHYYLDKRENQCLERNFTSLNNCKISLDGENCDECLDNYYFSEKENICVETKLCYDLGDNLKCANCINGYYLTEKNAACVKDKNCIDGNKDLAICTSCDENYYLDTNDYLCKSNTKNDKFINCKFADEECFECLENFYLGEDSKCSKTENCLSSENGECKQCSENYYLDLDNRCTLTENCIHSDENSFICNECKDNLFFNKTNKKCEKFIEGFENCKSTDNSGTKCEECKKNYYLSLLDNLCYNNNEEGIFYKCTKTDTNSTYCDKCEEGYFLGSKDNLCSKVEGCSFIENEERCAQCDDYYCLNMKNGICYDNDYEPINEESKIYYACNKTNDEGTECLECFNESMIIKNGLCYNIEDCEEVDGENCLKCKSIEDRVWTDFCLNKDYGCVSSYNLDCHICDNSYDFDDCNKCKDGYKFDEDNNCVEIEDDAEEEKE